MTSPANPVNTALGTRRAVRAFLPTPVQRADIEAILEAASHAPSGTNTQPWKVYVLTGESLVRLSRNLLAAYDDPQRARERAVRGGMSLGFADPNALVDTLRPEREPFERFTRFLD
jgi:nitroreductase